MATPALLPLSGRRLPPLNLGTSFPHHRATLRLSEKFILLLILSAFITLCFGAFFFLPDSSKHKRFDLGLEDVLIPHVDTSKGGKNLGGYLIHGQGHDEHRHRLSTPGPNLCWCFGQVIVSQCYSDRIGVPKYS
nr:mannosyl-oligosaccharide 1,2-alpha-mannosidase IB-like isoform X3 [Chelonoidis abingdonii]